MSPLTDEQVARIAERLATRFDRAAASSPAAAGSRDGRDPASAQSGPCGDGVFPDVDAAVEAALIAFHRLARSPLELRVAIIGAIRTTMLRECENLARHAHEETGLGRLEDKIRKNRLVTRKTPGVEQLHPEAMTGDRGLTLTEPAPYGVIGAITPVTNATSTIISNAIGMIAAGNCVVFNAHPAARACGLRTVQLINQAVVGAGGPANLATAVAAPTIETAQTLMRHPRVRLLVVTGGEGVVAAAMQSGKRAICAGPGNPPVVVDESADIEQAARDIVLGASFDNNIICVDEKEVFAVAGILDSLLAAMRRQGALVLDAIQMQRLERVIFERTNGPRAAAVMRKEWIGKDAARLLAEIGVTAGREIRLAVAEVPASHPLIWTEQMMPVLPVARADNADQAIDLAIAAEGGRGHTAAMHSRNLDHLSRMAREVNCSIFVKNGPCYAGLGEGGEGFSSFTIASPTGEGLTGPISFTRQRRCVLVDSFRIV